MKCYKCGSTVITNFEYNVYKIIKNSGSLKSLDIQHITSRSRQQVSKALIKLNDCNLISYTDTFPRHYYVSLDQKNNCL